MALPPTVTYDSTAYNLLMYAPGGAVGKEIRRRSMSVAARAAELARQRLGRNSEYAARSGRLAGNYRVEVEYPIPIDQGGFRFKVVNRTRGQNPGRSQSYAGPIEGGTAPHKIRPRKSGKKLVFFVNGRKVVVNEVNWKAQPGSPMNAGTGYRILEDAVRLVWRAS